MDAEFEEWLAKQRPMPPGSRRSVWRVIWQTAWMTSEAALLKRQGQAETFDAAMM